MEHGSLEPSNKPPPEWFRHRLLKIPTRLPENAHRRFRDLNKETLADKINGRFPKKF
jgi:hypothetical protein